MPRHAGPRSLPTAARLALVAAAMVCAVGVVLAGVALTRGDRPGATPSGSPAGSAATPSTTTTDGPGQRATVVGVADAVTLDVRLPDGRDVVRVRALGIQGPGPCYADDSTAFARRVLNGQAVDLVAGGPEGTGNTAGPRSTSDPESPHSTPTSTPTVVPGTPDAAHGPTAAPAVDRFDRRLQRVVLEGGRDYAVLAAEAGIARTYSAGAAAQTMPPVRDAEARAKAAGRGVWGPPCGGRSD